MLNYTQEMMKGKQMIGINEMVINVYKCIYHMKVLTSIRHYALNTLLFGSHLLFSVHRTDGKFFEFLEQVNLEMQVLNDFDHLANC